MQSSPHTETPLQVTLLTGGFDRPYVLGLALALAAHGVTLDVIGSDEVYSEELGASPNINFLNLQGGQRSDVIWITKAYRLLVFYTNLILYARTSRSNIFHILWNNKCQLCDRTLMMLYYKLLRKTVVLTVHNVNAAKRDSTDSLLNRLTLRIQYHLSDHIFVHTTKMRNELFEEFGVPLDAVTIVPFGINNAVPITALTSAEARKRLGIRNDEKTILFFGAIRPYKGLEYLVAAFTHVISHRGDCRLIIAGETKKGAEHYVEKIRRAIHNDLSPDHVLQRLEHIPDREIEVYFKAADVLVLPYTRVYQSGVLFLAYSFGLPVLAADVASFKEDVLEGRTGFLCTPRDPVDLARGLMEYFESDLFNELHIRRQEIRDYANTRHSWAIVAQLTRSAYNAHVHTP